MSRKQMDQDVDGVPIFNVTNNSHVIDWKNISNISFWFLGPSWSYGSWFYNYLCNQCLSPL